VPIVPEERSASAKKLGLTSKLDDIDSIPVPAHQASPGSTNIQGGEIEPPSIKVVEDVPEYRQPSGRNEYDTLAKGVELGNEYDALAAEENEVKKGIVAQSMYLGTGKDPDRMAKVMELSRQVNLPPDVVERNFDMVSRKQKLASNDYDSLVAKTPALAQWLAEPNNAAVAHDDVEGLTKIEQAVQDHGFAFKALSTLNQGITQGAAGIARIPNLAGAIAYAPYNAYQKYTGGQQTQYPASNPVADYLDKQASVYSGAVPELSGDVVKELSEGNYARAGKVAGYQVIGQIPQIAAVMMSGGSTKVLGVLGGIAAADRNKELTDQGVDPSTGLPLAVATGAVEVGTEALGTFRFIETMGKALVKKAGKQGALEVFKSMGKVMLSGGATEATEESVGQFAKSMMDYSTGVDPDALKKLPKDVANAGILGFLTGGAAMGPAVTTQAAKRVAQNQQTTLAKELYLSLGQSIGETKTNKRLKPAMKEFVEGVVKNGPVEFVYVSPEAMQTYFQNQGESPAGMLNELGVGSLVDEARDTGQPIKIPLSTWVEKFVDTEHYLGLQDDIKFDPNGESINERKANDEQAKTQLEATDKEANPEAEDKPDESGNAVRKIVEDQLKAIGKDPKEAALVGSQFDRLALVDPAGRTALQIFKGYGLTIGDGSQPMAAEASAAQSLSQDYTKPADIALDYTPNGVELNDSQRKAEESLGRTLSQPDAEEKYAALPESMGGKFLDTDAARSLSPDYASGREGAMLHTQSTHAPAGQFIWNLYKKKLKAAPTGSVVLMGGGGGSGKSTFYKPDSPIVKAVKAADIVYDGTGQRFDDQDKKIKLALDSGRPVVNVFIYAPLDVAAPRAVKRFDKSGRTIPPKQFAEGHVNALANFLSLAEKYKGQKGLIFKAFDNSGKAPVEISLEKLNELRYDKDVSGDDAIKALLPKAEEALKDVEREVEQTRNKSRSSEEARGVRRRLYQSGASEPTGSSGPSSVGRSSGQAQSDQSQPALKEAALTEGFSLFQDGKDEPRGRINFGKNRQFNIELLRKANKSTFAHEMTHFYVEVMADVVADVGKIPEADRTAEQQKFIADQEHLMEWAGNTGTGISVEAHEKIARGFEKYLYEGVAPTPRLREIFARFRTWLLHVYKMFGPNAELTPEVRDIMDRWVASDAELESARHEQNQSPLFSDPKFQGMSVEKTKAYLRAAEEAKEYATTEINKKLLAHHEKVRSEEWASEKALLLPEIDAQVSAQPIYMAIESLRTGTMADGSPLKLSAASVAEFGKDVGKGFPKGVVATKKSGAGLGVAVAAELLGFDSANDLITDLTNAEDKVKLIDRMAEEEMARRFPDLLTDGTLPQEVMEVVHNQSRAKMLRMELEHLASNNMPVLKEAIRRVARRVPTERAVREQAQRIIGGKSIKEISPYSYQRSEARSAKEAGILLAKGDIDGAFQAKQRELLSHELFLAATQAKENFDKTLEKFKKISKADEKLAKTRDMDLVNAARGILAQFGVGKTDGTVEQSLKQIKAYDPETYAAISALVEDATQNVGPIDQISYDDFVALSDSVNAIWDISRSIKQVEIDGNRMDLEEILDIGKERIKELAGSGPTPGTNQAISDEEKRSLGLRSLVSMASRVEHWGYAMDKGNINGFFTKYLIRPILQGTTQYRLKRIDTMKALAEIVRGIEILNDKQVIDATELGYKFTKPELIMAILHSGNDSNLRKLLDGRRWGEIEDGELDRSSWDAFTARAYAEGIITKSDMDAAQAIWDLNEKLKPDAQKAHKDMFGYYFNEITADPIITPWGEYRGGYMPALADHHLSVDSSIREGQSSIEESPAQMFPTTGRGFTKSRQERYTTPLSLDFSKLKNHVDKVLKFSHIEPRIKDATKILNNRGFRSEINRYDNGVVNNLLMPWLKRAATQKASAPGGSKEWDRITSVLRKSTSIQFMVLNVTNAIQNTTSILPSMVRVGPTHLAGSMKRYVFSPKRYAETVIETSDYMKSRMGENTQEIVKDIDDFTLNPSKFSELKDSAIHHGYALDRMTNGMMEVVIWGAAFDQHMSETRNHAESVQFADATVRQSVAGMNPEDISRFEAGTPFVRLFTMFSTFFNTQANLLKAELAIAKEEGGVSGAARAARAGALIVMLPAIASALIYRLMSGKGLDEDDDGEYFDDFLDIVFGSPFRYMIAMAPGGSIVNLVVNRFNDKPFDDKLNLSPAFSGLEKAAGAVPSIYSAVAEGGSASKALREGLVALGLATGLPLAPIGKPLGYIADVESRKAKPTGPIDYSRGLITGQPGKK